jgi:hypothetical protein
MAIDSFTEFASEFAVSVGDARLTERALLIGRRLWEHMHSSLRDACQTWTEFIGAVRFFANDAVTLDSVLAAHQEATLARVQACAEVYAIQDTSELEYSARKVQGLGVLNTETRTGFYWHMTYVVAPEGIPLGIWQVYTWMREHLPRASPWQRKSTPLAEKESHRWLAGYQAAGDLQRRSGTPVISVADREADLYEIYAEATTAAPDTTAAWVIRSQHDRSVVLQDGRRRLPLRFALALAPVAGGGQVAVPAAPGRDARTATIQLKIVPLTLCPPYRPVDARLPSVGITVVWVHEVGAPAGCEPLDWLLLTSLPVTTLAAAVRVVRIYARRWEIEIFFRTWKSGCRVERLQLSTRTRLEKCLAMYAIVAWRVLFLTRLGRHAPSLEAALFFSPMELQLIRGMARQRAPRMVVDHTVGSVVRAVACIGGFYGRPAEEYPGAETLWKGLMRVYDGMNALRCVFPEAGGQMCI